MRNAVFLMENAVLGSSSYVHKKLPLAQIDNEEPLLPTLRRN